MGDLSSPSWVIEAVIVPVGGRRHAAGDKSARPARGQNDLARCGNRLPVAGSVSEFKNRGGELIRFTAPDDV